MKQIYSEHDLKKLQKKYRANLINSLSGFKSANLIGTKDNYNKENLCVVSSVMHIGSNPALMGVIFRPNTVPRHTYENILETCFFTINAIHDDILTKAHLTSQKFPKYISEFKEVELTPVYKHNFFAPFVKESHIKIGLSLEEHYTINCNGTHLIIGKVLYIETPKEAIDSEGRVLLETLNTTCISGLDTYHQVIERITPSDLHDV